jgi:drug/metabolite transporter (DMT)-like permease
MIAMLVFGTLNTVLMKMQDEVVVGYDSDGKPRKFNHPYFQCAVMFLGEFFCLGLFAAKRAAFGNPNGQEDKINPILIAVPAMFDICGSSLMFIALTLCAASVYQMMRGTIVVITAVMALLFLGRKQYAHHWISLFTIVLGVFSVGFVSIMASRNSSSADCTSITGICLLLLAQCFTGG